MHRHSCRQKTHKHKTTIINLHVCIGWVCVCCVCADITCNTVNPWRSEENLGCCSVPSTLFEVGPLVHCCVHQATLPQRFHRAIDYRTSLIWVLEDPNSGSSIPRQVLLPTERSPWPGWFLLSLVPFPLERGYGGQGGEGCSWHSCLGFAERGSSVGELAFL